MTSNIYQYETSSLIGDYLKSSLGIAATGGPVVFLNTPDWLQVILTICLVLFSLFLIRTIIRQNTLYHIENELLYETSFRKKELNLNALDLVDIRYFSTQKNRENGWFQLKMTDKKTKIIVDSSLNGFDTIIQIVTNKIKQHNLTLDSITSDNLNAILKRKGH